MTEIWKAVPGFEAAYEVSTLGRVRSLDRVRKTKKGWRHYTGVVRKLTPMRGGALRIGLRDASGQGAWRVDEIVLHAFVGAPREPARPRWHNGDRSDNRLCNLYWGPRA